ncbi:MAG: SusC/RagA family TonB-linked outer membrane protein [Prolixibacteraceae bacterium]
MNHSIFNLNPGASVRKSKVFILLFLLSAIIGIQNGMAQEAQKIVVSGVIRNDVGETVVGVNVVIKGTTTGTVSNIDGEYNIIAKANDLLMFRFIGFAPMDIPISGRSSINVIMKTDITDLDEVVVVGYGEVKRANLLGSVSSMSAKEIEDIPVTNMTNLLEGRLAGVHISPAQPTGNPGASTRVKIRAETTFGEAGGTTKDQTPLYVIDGFDASQSDFEMLDPSEVESISVLKDASAAVYGSKGANGVILVRTKRGKPGKLRLSYSGSQGFMDATQQTEMLSAYDHARMLNARYKDDITFEQINALELDRMKDLDYNWLDNAWKSSSISRHSINVSGGTDKVQYYGGGTYVYTEGNFPELGVGKYSYRLGLDAEIVEGLKASVTVNIDSRDYKRPYYSGSGNNTMEDFFQVLLQAPRWSPYSIDDKYVGNNVNFNPFALFNSGSYRQSLDKGNNMNVKLQYDFKKIKGLKAEASYSLNEGHSYSKNYSIPYTINYFNLIDSVSNYVLGNTINQTKVVENSNQISESYSYSTNYQFRTTLSYANNFGPHSVSGFILYEQSESSGYGFEALSEHMVIPNLPLQEAFDYLNADANSSMSESGRLGGVSRINYSYADKYLLEAAGRYEGTTKFAPGQRLGFFPSIALGWVLSEENFMKDNLSFINFLKLRGSYGITGFASVGDYEYTLAFGPSGNYILGNGNPVGGMGVSGTTDVISSGVTWEKSKMQNYGMDMRFLDGRLGLDLDIYYTHQVDILDNRASEFSLTTGIKKMPSENIGELKAWGYDASLIYNGKVGPDFTWYVRGIFNFGSNKILSRPSTYAENDFRYPVGQSTFAAGREEGYLDEGIIRSQAQLNEINAYWNETWGHDYRPFGNIAEVGMLYYQDIGRKGVSSDGEPPIVFEPDGIIDYVSDKGYIQRVNDHFVWKNIFPSNLSIGGAYKDFSLSMLFTMQYGISDQVVDKLARTVPTKDGNSPAFWSDFWSEDNPDGAYPHPKFATQNQYVSTFWMKDNKQLRMSNLNLSYTLPSKLSTKLGIPTLRLYFVGTNLWSPITTFDYKEDAIARYNTYPLLKTFSFGVNLKL